MGRVLLQGINIKRESGAFAMRRSIDVGITLHAERSALIHADAGNGDVFDPGGHSDEADNCAILRVAAAWTGQGIA